MANKSPGKIITFYSYKGGTGRSMALANVAWVLASQGKRVLMLDWDLEAPGLHRYFHPFLVDKELSASDGLIDFVLKFAAAAAAPGPVSTGAVGTDEATVYLAPTDAVLDAAREAVRDVLLKSGYTVLPDARLPDDPDGFEGAVRGYLRRAALSVHLIGQAPAGEEESYPYVHRQNALAAERDNEQGFSRLIWLPPGVQPLPRQLLLGEPAGLETSAAARLLQAPLDELFNTIRELLRREQGDKNWYKPYANILRYASSLEGNFTGEDGGREGSLDFIPAGRQGTSYSTRVNSFNWQNFYDRLGGGVLFELAKERMRAEYDYILIDSRTGVSDTSGICTVQMPDILVVCFTLNNQSIEGAGAVADSVHAQRPELHIFPVPTRVEKSEKERLDVAREVARARFDHLLDHIKGEEPEKEEERKSQYWGDVEIFYEAFYAYEEVLATFRDKPNQISSLLASVERLTGYLTDNEVTRLAAVPEPERQIVLAKYARQAKRLVTAPPAKPSREFWFYLSYSRNDDIELIERFFSDLSDEVRMQMGLSRSQGVGFFDSKTLTAGDDWVASLVQALEGSRVLVALYSPSYFKSEHCGKEFQYFLERMNADDLPAAGIQPSRILPVVWVPPRGELPEVAKRIQYVFPEGGLRRLMRSGRPSGEYADVLDKLAGRLVDMAQELPPPSSRGVPSLKDMRSAFEQTATPSAMPPAPDFPETGGPGTANFIYVVARAEEIARSNTGMYGDSGPGWRPFLPETEERIGYISMAVAAAEDFVVEMLPLDARLPARVRHAEQNNSSVILVVDPWTTLLSPYREILRAFDEYAFINCAVLIIWNAGDEETVQTAERLRRSLEETFPLHLGAARDDLWVDVHSADEFRRILHHSLNVLRSRILARGRVIKRLEAGEGIPKPTLSVRNDAQ